MGVVPNDSASALAVRPRPRRIVVAGITAVDEDADASELDELLVRRARALRDAGTEVIWAGSGLHAEQVAAIAVSEDADGVEVAPAEATVDVASALGRLEVDDVEVVAATR